MRQEIATVTAKGQVTIPKAVREALGLQPHDRVLFLVEGDRVVLVPLHRRPLSSLYAALPASRPFPGHEAEREAVRQTRIKHVREPET